MDHKVALDSHFLNKQSRIQLEDLKFGEKQFKVRFSGILFYWSVFGKKSNDCQIKGKRIREYFKVNRWNRPKNFRLWKL